jgi:hypothetical protein
MSDIFKSTPAKGAIVNDWTDKTLTLDLVNSIGENYHFEILPREHDNLPTRASDTPFTNSRNSIKSTVVNMTFPIASLQ